MKADLIGWYAAGCSISGLTVYVGLHGSTYNPHVLNCALSLVISAIIDLSYALFHKKTKKVGVFAFTSFDMVSPTIYCVHQYCSAGS